MVVERLMRMANERLSQQTKLFRKGETRLSEFLCAHRSAPQNNTFSSAEPQLGRKLTTHKSKVTTKPTNTYNVSEIDQNKI